MNTRLLRQIRGEAARLADLEAENARLREALKPFTSPQAIGLILRPKGSGASSSEPILVEYEAWFVAARAALSTAAEGDGDGRNRTEEATR